MPYYTFGPSRTAKPSRRPRPQLPFPRPRLVVAAAAILVMVGLVLFGTQLLGSAPAPSSTSSSVLLPQDGGASYLTPWHSGNPKGSSYGQTLQPLTAAHSSGRPGIYWLGSTFQTFKPYAQALQSSDPRQGVVVYAPAANGAAAILSIETTSRAPTMRLQRVQVNYKKAAVPGTHRAAGIYTKYVQRRLLLPAPKLPVSYTKLARHPLPGGYYVLPHWSKGASALAVVIYPQRALVRVLSYDGRKLPLTQILRELRLYPR
jgi:hypothetical protein